MIERGAVVEYPAVFAFESYSRPYLILSDSDHPYAGEEYVAVAITTTEHGAAVPIEEENWEKGGLPRRSHVKPWQPVLLKHEDVLDAFGLLNSAFVDRVADSIATIIGAKR